MFDLPGSVPGANAATPALDANVPALLPVANQGIAFVTSASHSVSAGSYAMDLQCSFIDVLDPREVRAQVDKTIRDWKNRKTPKNAKSGSALVGDRLGRGAWRNRRPAVPASSLTATPSCRPDGRPVAPGLRGAREHRVRDAAQDHQPRQRPVGRHRQAGRALARAPRSCRSWACTPAPSPSSGCPVERVHGDHRAR